MTVTYLISLPDPSRARGSQPSLSFTAHGADTFAEQLQTALRDPGWWERWRALQPNPDEMDPALGITDPMAHVTGKQNDLRIDLSVTTSIPGDTLKQRMRMLAGSFWELHDVR